MRSSGSNGELNDAAAGAGEEKRGCWLHPCFLTQPLLVCCTSCRLLQGEVLIKGEPRRGLISDDDTSDKLKVGLVFQVR